MFKKIAAILAFAALLAYSAVNYPYPQRKNYGNSTINVANSTADNDLKVGFQNYIRDFYVAQGDQARIKFFDPDKPAEADNTVSEGIGYAMLMAVYFSDASTSYEDHFKKLWAYYNAHKNGNGFMHWKIQGFGSATQQNGATDAELDVALALAMARYQFGNTQYENDAKALIAKIFQYEVSSGGLLKPGDAWESDRNPSYVAPAAFEIFKGLDNSNWSNVLSTNYTFLKNNQNSSTGLPSDWAQDNGSPKQCSSCGYTGTNYGQDAVRAPWRWATANAWFGQADAKTLLTNLGTWVNNQNATAVKGPIGLSGSMGSNANSSYLGSLMCALTSNSAHQTKLNSFFSTMMGQTGTADASYYNQSMKLLTGLLVSGNMPNLKACASSSGCGTNMPAVGSGNGNSTSLDRLSSAGTDSEDDRGLSALWEAWYAYTDVDADDKSGGKAKSTITNAKFPAKDENKNCQEIESYRVVLQGSGSDNAWAVRIPSYTLDRGTYKYEPFVGLGLDARKNGKSGGYTLSSCTGGFSYSYKGSAHKFKVLSSAVTEGSGEDHYKNITSPATDWTTVSIPPAELQQPTWVPSASSTAFSLANVRGWGWELVGAATSGGTALSATTGSLAIKDFKCLGTMTLPSKPTFQCRSNSSGASSSSRGGGASSSSSVSGGVSSSSTGGGNSSSSTGGGSSSSDGTDPIISLSQHVANNGAFAIKNGVNLQVSKNANIEVFGLNGKSVRKHEFSNGSYSVLLGDLPKGLYIVKVQFGNQREILRVPVR
jgi:endo-1,4-beta-D-glucanase Y